MSDRQDPAHTDPIAPPPAAPVDRALAVRLDPPHERLTMVLRRPSAAIAITAAVGAVVAVTLVCRACLDHRTPDIVMLYLLGVVVIAMRFGHAASLVAAVLSVGALDFFFTEPYWSFAVTDKRYVVTFAIMLFVAVVISNLMARIRRSAEHVRQREMRTAKLYAMSRELSIAGSLDDVVEVAHKHLRDLLGGGVSLRTGDASAGTTAAADVDAAPAEGERSIVLRAPRGPIGAVVVHASLAGFFAVAANRDLLDTYASQIALAMERARLADDSQRAQLEVQKERLRNALLSSVSHDLRTPLAVVKGAVTALLGSADVAPARRQEYLQTISDEASRLNRLVRNLLNMTSLEAGALRAHKEWQPLDEVIGVALNRLEESLERRPVRVEIAPEAALAPFDATLIEQVLVNLVENAVRYTPAESPIDIRATRVAGGVQVEVADRGAGVHPALEEQIFEKFSRAAPPRTGGMGLGLTICRGILTVHGGKIWCEGREGGGAVFRFFLPHETEAPPMNGLPELAADP